MPHKIPSQQRLPENTVTIHDQVVAGGDGVLLPKIGNGNQGSTGERLIPAGTTEWCSVAQERRKERLYAEASRQQSTQTVRVPRQKPRPCSGIGSGYGLQSRCHKMSTHAEQIHALRPAICSSPCPQGRRPSAQKRYVHEKMSSAGREYIRETSRGRFLRHAESAVERYLRRGEREVEEAEGGEEVRRSVRVAVEYSEVGEV